MLVPSPKWLDTGSNAWQMAAATFVGLQSIPGLVILYGGIVKKKWALNSAFMAMYAFAAVMIVWVLWAYNMAFGPQWFPFLGKPSPALSGGFMLGQATGPAAASGMPALGFPMATMMFFQFVFAAITVIILAGSLIGRMSFKAWIIFVPVWMTFVYTVGCFSIWGGGWLAGMGAADFSGGYVIHLAAGTSGFVAAALIGPRIQQDRDHFPPNSLLMALAGAGILWLGWNGFNGGYVNGWGAIAIGVCTGIIPWIMMNKVQTTALFKKVDDTLCVLSTHGVAGLLGGLLVGVFACPDMLVYIGTDKDAPGISITGLLYGDSGHQLLVQLYAAIFIIAYNVIATVIILKVISIFVSLRMDEATLRVGDDAVHGETAYNFGDGDEVPAVAD